MIEAHDATTGRRMHKAPLPHENACVRRRAASAKHHKIAHAQTLRANRLAPGIEFRHGARWRGAGAALVSGVLPP